MNEPILVIGSVSIDYSVYTNTIPKKGETKFGESYYINIGGKGVNQAIQAHYLSSNVRFIGAIGKDASGERIKEFLTSINLPCSLKQSNKPTGSAFITVESDTKENRIIVIPGANLDLLPEDLDKYDSYFKNSKYLIMQFETLGETLVYALKKAKQYGITTIVNPAPYKEFNRLYYQYIDYLIPNEGELDQLTSNIKGELEDKINYLLSQGVKNIIVTLGEKGSYFKNKEKSFYISPYKVNAIDTTGAGDSYIGALVSALSSSKDIKEAMDYASRASSITVSRKGASSSLAKLIDLKI